MGHPVETLDMLSTQELGRTLPSMLLTLMGRRGISVLQAATTVSYMRHIILLMTNRIRYKVIHFRLLLSSKILKGVARFIQEYIRTGLN